MYNIVFSPKARKQLQKLETDVQIRICNALDKIKVRPEDYLTQMVDDPSFKLRVGDYRVLIDLNHTKSQIEVIKVGHRKNIYK
ncbi:MAG TPA: type II toxin-antitoxin system RelE/ParE family toxin [Candidatus Nanoarchaeia archaeon]|nr:type II toxin-antitoxin system RelE/ParE family toxin [Candidatus Nanoarchaeia archaeon]